jgi:hypothetical protein
MLLGIRRMWRVNRVGLAPYLLLIGVFPITYYLTHPMMDYRQPIEPAVVVLATAGAMSLRLRRSKSNGLAEPVQHPEPIGLGGGVAQSSALLAGGEGLEGVVR